MNSEILRRGQLLADRYEVMTKRGEAVLWISYSAYVRKGSPPQADSGAADPYVLLKIVRPQLLAEPGACDYLVQTLQHVQGLQHPGLRRLLDVQLCAELQTVVIVEPLQAGPGWDSLMRLGTTLGQEQFSLETVRKDIARIAQVLMYLHERQLCHGDLRPEAIYGGTHEQQLGDVGLGASLPRQRYLDAVRSAGELELIAPEVRAGQAADARADIYGLAALCKKLLALGQADGWDAVAEKKPALHRVIERSLSEDPQQRHGSVAALARDIEVVADRGRPLHLTGMIWGERAPDSSSIVMGSTQRPSTVMGCAPTAQASDVKDPVDGWIGTDAPVELCIETTDLVRAVAVRDLLQRALIDEALTRDNQQVTSARLAATVRMELVSVRAADFTIQALSPPEQPVSQDELTVWEWLITAHPPQGDKLLRLTVTNLLDAQGRPLGKALPSRELAIRVTAHNYLGRMIFTADGLRQLLGALLPSEAALDALIRQRFPRVQERLRSDLDREAKVNLLVAHTPSRALIDVLQDEHRAVFAKHAAAYALPVETAFTPVTSDTPLAGMGASSPDPGRPGHAASQRRLVRSLAWRWIVPVLAAGLTALILFRPGHRPGCDPEANEPERTRALTPLTKTEPSAAPVRLGTSYAVLFATTRYDDPRWPPLNTPDPDANEIAADLRNIYGFSVEKVSDPSVAEIRARIRSLAQRRYEGGDQLLLVFSGHGDKDEVLNKGWVIARDSRTEERQTAYPYSELREDIDNIPCRHILLVLDVCFGGLFDPSIREAQVRGPQYQEASVQEFIGRKLRYRSRLYVSSVDQKTEAPEGRGHSPFTWRFLEALRSGGGSDGVLTWNELVSHLEKLNPEPRGGVFPRTMNSDPGGDFLFVTRPRAQR